MTRGVSQFLAGFIPVMRAVRFIRPVTKLGLAVKFAAVGAAVDATVFDPHEKRLSNLMDRYPALSNPVTEYLKADPTDSSAEGRFKNAVEGLLVGEIAGQFFRAVRFIKLLRLRFRGTGVSRQLHRLKTESLEEVVQILRQAAKKVEPRVTATLQRLAAKFEGRLAGLEYKIKDAESLGRKINADSVDKVKIFSEVAAEIYDVLRYTVVLPAEKYAKRTKQIIAALQVQGYTKVRVKNLWRKPAGYRGVNTVFVTPDGHYFELQFHTKQSFSAKQTTHDIYKRQRKLDPGSSEAIKLEKQADEVFSKVGTPPAAGSIQ
jgi:hypothetical protein